MKGIWVLNIKRGKVCQSKFKTFLKTGHNFLMRELIITNKLTSLSEDVSHRHKNRIKQSLRDRN